MTLQFFIVMIASAINDRLQCRVVCRSRLGGMLNFYHREAA